MKLFSGLITWFLLVLTSISAASAETSPMGGPVAPVAAERAAEGAWYVVSRTRNKCDLMQVLRRGVYEGARGWGYRKIASKHNVRRIKIWRRVVQASCGEPEGGVSTTFIYRARIVHVVCTNGECVPTGESEVLRLVQQTASNKGAITMYCVGRLACPNWINSGYLPRPIHGQRHEVRIVPL